MAAAPAVPMPPGVIYGKNSTAVSSSSASPDPVAFADLMMEQQVVLPNASPERLREIVAAIKTVTQDMDGALDRGTGDSGRTADLRFERGALKALARRLTGHDRSPKQAGGDRAPSDKTDRPKTSQMTQKH